MAKMLEKIVLVLEAFYTPGTMRVMMWLNGFWALLMAAGYQWGYALMNAVVAIAIYYQGSWRPRK